MKTITCSVKTPAGTTIYRVAAESWLDFTSLTRESGPPVSGVDENLIEQVRWHTYLLRTMAMEQGFGYDELEEGTFRGGEER